MPALSEATVPTTTPKAPSTVATSPKASITAATTPRASAAAATAPKAPAAAATTPKAPATVRTADHLASYAGDPNFMTSLARGLSVLEAFAQETPQMTISQLSNKTGLSRAAVRRCLYTLAKLVYA